jgi:galactokinase
MGLEEQNSAVADYGGTKTDDVADVGRNLTISLLTDFMNKINDAMTTVTENDSNYEHSTKVKIDVYDVLPCCKEILREKRFRQSNQLLMPSSRRRLNNYFEMSRIRVSLLVRKANLYTINTLYKELYTS